jgi:hypothetical protein
MATFKTFEDEGGNQLRAYENDKGLCYITCGDLKNINGDWQGYIVLDSEDVSELIIELQFIKKQMEDNG